MPAEGFLQKFHDLAEPNEDVRCAAALGVRQALAANGEGGSVKDGEEEDLQYALRRLVRGVQSSRQCCRQGFSLALAEVLAAFPGELHSVLQLVKQQTELQAGLKPSEQKERLLGRLFAYAAVLEAGSLHTAVDGVTQIKAKKSSKSALSELASGLHEIYAARPYLRGPAAKMLVEMCEELCTNDMAVQVPAVLARWKLDDTVGVKEDIDVHAAGLALGLRLVYEDADKSSEGIKEWPVCVRKDTLSDPAMLKPFLRALAASCAAVQLNEALPFELGVFCRWWFKPSKTRNAAILNECICRNLDEAFFPDKSSPSIEAQGLRVLADIFTSLRSSGHSGKNPQAEELLVALFERMSRGFGLLFRVLCWHKALTHPAAVFVQRRLLEAIGAVHSPQQKNKKQNNTVNTSNAQLQEWLLTDKTRLAILSALQCHQSYGAMKGAYQRQWQHALLAPLSPSGVRTRCASLLSCLLEELRSNKTVESTDGADGSRKNGPKVYAEQLFQLATHTRAPDEVILVVLCVLFIAAYFAPDKSNDTCMRHSFRAFGSAAGLPVATDVEDLPVPVLTSGAGANQTTGHLVGSRDLDVRAGWKKKLWTAIAALMKRTAPEMSEKVMVANPGPGDSETAKANPSAGSAPVVRSFAFHGCLSDGTLWVMRMHEWWDYVLEHAPFLGAVGPPMSPRLSPKRKKKTEVAASPLQCVVALSEDDAALRQRCLELCRAVLAEPESEGAMTSRQRNALCSLPLSLSLMLLDSEDEQEREAIRAQLQDAVAVLEKLPSSMPEGSKQRAKAQRRRSEILAEVPRIAAELFVEASGLIKEAALAAWRELGEFTSDETLTSLSASVRDVEAEPDEQEDKDAEDDDEDGDAAPSAQQAARAAAFAQATEQVKAAQANGKADDEDDDDIQLDGDELWKQLTDDPADGDGATGSLLTAFASSGLDGVESAPNKLSKRQQRLRGRQQDIMRKMREIELLEVFLVRFMDKKSVCVQVLQEMYQASLVAGRRAGMSGDNKDTEEGSNNAGEKKKKTRVDAALRRLESELMQRIVHVLSKSLKMLTPWSTVSKVCGWHSQEEWAGLARSLSSAGQGAAAAAAGTRPMKVGSVLLYWQCAAHHAQGLQATGANVETGAMASAAEAWELAEEITSGALRDWTSKRDCDAWCEAILGAFAARAPQLLVQLPWTEQIRSCRKTFIQRAQLSFVSNQLLRSQANPASLATLAAGITDVCTELLGSTLETNENVSKSQREKMRRAVLKSLVLSLRTQARKRPLEESQAGDPLLKKPTKKRIRDVVTKIRDSLSVKRGEVYQSCLHILRSLHSLESTGSGGSGTEGSTGMGRNNRSVSNQRHKKRRYSASSGDESTMGKRRAVSREGSRGRA